MNEHTDKIVDGQNGVTVKCKHCSSVILTPASAALTSIQFDLPLEVQSKQTDTANNSTLQTEPIGQAWTVDDMFKFHSVGFSTTVANTKYLVCADCELGPIGYHDLSSKKSYVALSRVDHISPKHTSIADTVITTTTELDALKTLHSV